MKKSFCIQRYYLKPQKLKDGNEIKIVFLSDLHCYEYGCDNANLIAAVRDAKPDYILVGGDMVLGVINTDLSIPLKLAQQLSTICPVYYANGNHEQRMKIYPDTYGPAYENYKSQLEKFNIKLLENAGEVISTGRGDICIWGLEIPPQCYRKIFKTTLSTTQIIDCIGTPTETCYNILLAHNPKFATTYAKWGADLILSGHLHGGVVRIPGIGGIVSPQGNIFPRYSGEHSKVDEADLVVSKGLGSHSIPIRIFNPKELVVVHLQ